MFGSDTCVYCGFEKIVPQALAAADPPSASKISRHCPASQSQEQHDYDSTTLICNRCGMYHSNAPASALPSSPAIVSPDIQIRLLEEIEKAKLELEASKQQMSLEVTRQIEEASKREADLKAKAEVEAAALQAKLEEGKRLAIESAIAEQRALTESLLAQERLKAEIAVNEQRALAAAVLASQQEAQNAREALERQREQAEKQLRDEVERQRKIAEDAAKVQLHRQLEESLRKKFEDEMFLKQQELQQETERRLAANLSQQARRDRIHLLQHVPVICTLDSETIDYLIESLEEKTFDPGSIIIQQGDVARAFYIIVDGHCTVVQTTSEPASSQAFEYTFPQQQIRLRYLSRGEFFGERAFLASSSPEKSFSKATIPVRSATVTANDVVHLLALSSQSFTLLLRLQPALREAFTHFAENTYIDHIKPIEEEDRESEEMFAQVKNVLFCFHVVVG